MYSKKFLLRSLKYMQQDEHFCVYCFIYYYMKLFVFLHSSYFRITKYSEMFLKINENRERLINFKF